MADEKSCLECAVAKLRARGPVYDGGDCYHDPAKPRAIYAIDLVRGDGRVIRPEWCPRRIEEDKGTMTESSEQVCVQMPTVEALLAKLLDRDSQLDRIREAIKHEEKEMRWSRAGYDLPEHVQKVLYDQRHTATKALNDAKQFRDDMLVLLRSLALVAEMVGNAATHSEKSARVRGLVELLESGIDKLRKMDFDYSRTPYWPDIFRSDYPSRSFVQRIYELEAQVERLESEKKEQQELRKV